MHLEVLVKEFLFECEIREYTEKTVENCGMRSALKL